MNNDAKYRRDIQVLRGLAVLAVVLFHAKESYFPLGYLGVDVFFVISGFVVTPLIMRIFITQASSGSRLTNLKEFYKRRFYRLAPALATTLVISAVLVFLLAPIDDHRRFARQGIATLFLIGNLGAHRYAGNYFTPNANPLIHTWSLSVEEQIYIFLPIILILIIGNYKRIKNITSVVLAVLTLMSFSSFLFPAILEPLYSRAGIGLETPFSFYSPFDRIWQFTLGGLTFLALNQYQNRIRKISRGINLILVTSIVLILFGPIQMEIRVSSILASLLAVIIIIFKSLDALPNMFFQKLQWLGDRSYSIYLVHMPLIYLAIYSPVVQIDVYNNRLVQKVIAVFASILLGAMSYSKIENRFRNVGKRKHISLKTTSTVLILTFIIPLSLIVLMDRGVYQQYWGLNKQEQRPVSGELLDPNCLRETELGPPCSYSNPGAIKTVLLVGDSHAGHISQAVVDAAKAENWNSVIWAHSGCRIQFRLGFKGDLSDNCIKMNRKMKTWVLKNKPDAIIVSQYVHRNSSQSNLRDALSILHITVPNILLIENNPIFPDEKDFMIEKSIISPIYNAPKSFNRSEMLTVDIDSSNQLRDWAKDNAISTMNIDSLFCDAKICTRYSSAGWLYRDHSHLSAVGADLTIPQLRVYLKGL